MEVVELSHLPRREVVVEDCEVVEPARGVSSAHLAQHLVERLLAGAGPLLLWCDQSGARLFHRWLSELPGSLQEAEIRVGRGLVTLSRSGPS
jgi:hypothetical protein